MRPVRITRFDVNDTDAVAMQTEMACMAVIDDHLPDDVRMVAGCDVAYDDRSGRVFAAVAVLEARTLEVVETAVKEAAAAHPYVPGLFSFRELPALIPAIEQLRSRPDLVLCDGHGIAHPRRFGLASHLGVAFDVPSIGCAKTRLVGTAADPGVVAGSRADLRDRGEVIGAVLRTRTGVKPVYVSPGHRVSVATACEWVLRLCRGCRIPEPLRAADRLARHAAHG